MKLLAVEVERLLGDGTAERIIIRLEHDSLRPLDRNPLQHVGDQADSRSRRTSNGTATTEICASEPGHAAEPPPRYVQRLLAACCSEASPACSAGGSGRNLAWLMAKLGAMKTGKVFAR